MRTWRLPASGRPLQVPGEPIELHDFYVPAGGDVPDPAVNEKFAHKLAFVSEATNWFAARPGLRRSVLVGDLNIAPLEHDVWSHKQLLGVVSHTPIEVEHLLAWQRAGFTTRCATSCRRRRSSTRGGPTATRIGGRRTAGGRLDHIWVTPDLAPGLRSYTILKDARDWPQTSDHVPVCVELSV